MSYSWWSLISCSRMRTLMIHKSVDPIGHQMSTSYRSVSPTVSTRCQRGWWPIGCKTEVLWCSSARRRHQIPITSMCWQLGCSAPACRPRPRGLHRRWRHHVCSRHRDHQSLFRWTAADTSCAAFVDARCLADADSLTGHHKAWLLLFGVGWCVWIADATASVRAKRRRSTRVLCEEIRTHNSTSSWTSLAQSSQREFSTRLCVLAFRCLHGLAPSYLSETLHLSTEVDACRWLRSASTSILS